MFEEYDVNFLLPLIVLFPLLGALFNGIIGRRESRRLVAGVAIGSVALSFASAVVLFLKLISLGSSSSGVEARRLTYTVYRWFSLKLPTGSVADIDVSFLLDPLSGVMLLIVTGIGLLIHLYSASYMEHDQSFARFFTYLNLFMAAMLILILADSLPLMFVGWEGVGLCSYLLIGFWWTTPAYAAAGRKAFIYNRVGDFGVLLGMFLLIGAAGSLRFTAINQEAVRLAATPLEIGGTTLGISVATVACLCLFLGCTGKSAQFPLFVWLPDAMAGPTPVSALIHAATMVTAGIYLICRLSPLFVTSPVAMAVLTSVGAFTALVAAAVALVQGQMKRILAYSTVSQLGFMIAATGVGAFGAAVFHVFTHAFFKACLFLGAGSVMHAVHAHGDAELKELGGLRRMMPITHATFLLSCLAIAGIPPLSGFFSKDEILLGARTVDDYFVFAPWLGSVIWAVLSFAAILTAFYMMRLYFLTFAGTYRGAAASEQEAVLQPHESPRLMTTPLVILAIGAVAAGWLGLPHALHLPNLWGDWLHGSLAHLGEAHASKGAALSVMVVGTLVAVLGVALAFMLYRSGEPSRTARGLAHAMPKLRRFLLQKARFDELYQLLVIGPARFLASLVGFLDRVVVDGLLTRATAAVVRLSGFILTRVQTGVLYVSTTVFLLGIGGMAWWFLYPHPSVEYEIDSRQVTFQVGQGLGYTYRMDFDGDGRFDTRWKPTDGAAVSHTYSETAPREVVIRIVSPLPYQRTELATLQQGEDFIVPTKLLPGVRVGELPPALTYRENTVWLRHNGVPVDGLPAKRESIALTVGKRVKLGESVLDIGVQVPPTLQVRNAFGSQATKRYRLNLLPPVVPQAAASVSNASADGFADKLKLGSLFVGGEAK